MGEAHRQTTSKNRALSGIFWFKWKKEGENWITFVIRTFVLCNSTNMPVTKSRRFGESERVEHMRQRGEMHAGSWSGNLKESGHLKPSFIFGKEILKLIFKN